MAAPKKSTATTRSPEPGQAALFSARRKELFEQALGRALQEEILDADLLIQLGRLARASDPSWSPSLALARSLSHRLSEERSMERLSKSADSASSFLHWCASVDALGWEHPSDFTQPLIPPRAPGQPHDSSSHSSIFAERCPAGVLVLSPWREAAARALKEAKPSLGAPWSALALLLGLGRSVSQTLESISPSSSGAARDQIAWSAAHRAAASAEPAQMVSALALSGSERSPPIAHHLWLSFFQSEPNRRRSERLALRLPPLSSELDPSALGASFAEMIVTSPIASAWSREDRHDFLRRCASDLALREGHLGDSAPKSPALSSMLALFSKLDAGEPELPRELPLLLFRAALKEMAKQSHTFHPAFGSSNATLFGRSMTIKQLHHVAQSALMRATKVLPLWDPDPAAGRPPLAVELLQQLPLAPEPLASSIQSALHKAFDSGFSRAALDWREPASGVTQSIGNSVASLPKGKSSRWSALIAPWLTQLSEQGFDFDAKASPGSKSLRERMLSTQALAPIWPSIEASALARAARSNASSATAPKRRL